MDRSRLSINHAERNLSAALVACGHSNWAKGTAAGAMGANVCCRSRRHRRHGDSTRGKMKQFGHTQSSLLWAGASLPRLWVALTSFRSLVLGLAPRPRYGSPQYRGPLVRHPTVRASVSLQWAPAAPAGSTRVPSPHSQRTRLAHAPLPLVAPPPTPALASLAWRLAPASSPPATSTLPLSVFTRSRWSLASTPSLARRATLTRSVATSSIIRPQTVPLGLPPFRSALPFHLRCADSAQSGAATPSAPDVTALAEPRTAPSRCANGATVVAADPRPGVTAAPPAPRPHSAPFRSFDRHRLLVCPAPPVRAQ